MKLGAFFEKVLDRYVFNSEWRCLCCGSEIFSGHFCEECYSKLPFIDGAACNHCGRKTIAPEEYCTTCKNFLVSVDKGRSVFSYESPISGLIKKAKYDGQLYILDYFAQEMSALYLKNYFNADFLVFVPMTEKAKKARGYNQSEILAKKISEKTGVSVLDCIVKKKETERQATLNRAARLKNLKEAFKITDKKSVDGKNVVIVDDVTTTGATAEVIAERLKAAGAKRVYLITAASTPPIDKY